MVRLCTGCWSKVHSGDTVCRACGTDLSLIDELSYEEKLIRALMHFEPQTAMRAAGILAMLGSGIGAEAIAGAFANRADLDPIMGRAFLKAIAAITGETECDVALRLKKMYRFKSETADGIIEASVIVP